MTTLAHSGGRAQLYVDSIRLEPQPGGWQAVLVLRDADSGAPEPGFGVHVTASRPGAAAAGPFALNDPGADGRYAGPLPLSEGSWALTVAATELPGGSRAIPFTKTWPVTLVAGQSAEVAGDRPPGTGGSGVIVPLLLACLAAAALSTALNRRRRSRRAPSGGPSSTVAPGPPGDRPESPRPAPTAR